MNYTIFFSCVLLVYYNVDIPHVKSWICRSYILTSLSVKFCLEGKKDVEMMQSITGSSMPMFQVGLMEGDFLYFESLLLPNISSIKACPGCWMENENKKFWVCLFRFWKTILYSKKHEEQGKHE